MRISSAIEIAGCVSLSWIATLSGSEPMSPYCCMCRRTMSCSEADEKKNSCRSRSSCPAGVESAGIEHARDRLGLRAFLQRADVVAGVELVEQDRIDRLRAPEPQRIHPRAAPADDRGIEGHREDVLGRPPFEPGRAVRLLHRHHLPAEADLVGRFAALELPRIAVRQPVLRQFDLPALAHFLAEHAVGIADAVAVGRDLQRRHRVHEARREPAEAAIAERRVGLEIDEIAEVDIEILQRLPHLLHEADIAHGIAHQPPDEEFEAEVVDALLALPPGAAARFHPAVDDAVADREDGRLQPVVRPRDDRVLPDRIGQLFEDFGLERLSCESARLRRGGVETIGFCDMAQSDQHDDVVPSRSHYCTHLPGLEGAPVIRPPSGCRKPTGSALFPSSA